jgi:hypothetical protein
LYLTKRKDNVERVRRGVVDDDEIMAEPIA